MMSPTVYAVIPVHNRAAFTKRCLETLAPQVGARSVIVVDDGSTDGTADMVAQHFPGVTVLPGDGNLWWAGAVNLGIRHVLDRCAEDDFILVINDDLIVEPGYVRALLKAYDQYPNSIIGSLVVDIRAPDVVLSGGLRINWSTAKWSNLSEGCDADSFPADHVQRVSTLTGRGVLFPSLVFREVGLYKADKVKQCADTELPARAARAGYSLWVSYDARVLTEPPPAWHINARRYFVLGDAHEFFLGMRSHANLRTRYWFAMGALPTRWAAYRFFALDAVRLCYHFVRRLHVCHRMAS